MGGQWRSVARPWPPRFVECPSSVWSDRRRRRQLGEQAFDSARAVLGQPTADLRTHLGAITPYEVIA